MLQTQSSVTKRSFQHQVSQTPCSSGEVLWIALCMHPWNETVCYWLTRIFSIITLLDSGGGRWLSPGTDGQVHGTARFCTSSIYCWFLLLSLCVFNFFFETLYVLKNLAARKVGSWYPLSLDFKRGRKLLKAIPVYPRRMEQIAFYRVVSLNACTDLSAH